MEGGQSFECGSELRPEVQAGKLRDGSSRIFDKGSNATDYRFRSWAEPFVKADFKRWQKDGISQESIMSMATDPRFERV